MNGSYLLIALMATNRVIYEEWFNKLIYIFSNLIKHSN